MSIYLIYYTGWEDSGQGGREWVEKPLTCYGYFTNLDEIKQYIKDLNNDPSMFDDSEYSWIKVDEYNND